jgi:hypothetical protein
MQKIIQLFIYEYKNRLLNSFDEDNYFFNYKNSKNLVLCFMLILSYSIKSQVNINGTYNIVGEMSVYGDLTLSSDAQLYFQNSSTIHMFGVNTMINPDAEIFANTSSTQSGTGRILFTGSASQTLNGGNNSVIGGTQPTLINIAINNNNNITLSNTNTRVNSGVDFINGHLLIGNNNLELSNNATVTNANGSKHFVTNGSGFIAKEGFATAFSFPVGIAESDFTPALITPSAIDNFFVQVKDYFQSASDEFETADGVGRTWNIYSTAGAGANISLQHNTLTNALAFDPNDAFVTQYQGIQWVSGAQRNQGVWQLGTGANNVSGIGTVVNSLTSSRVYSTTSTTSGANGAFYSKSSNLLTPLPVALLDFTATIKDNNKSLLEWSTSNEYNSSFYEIETSLDGFLWKKIGQVDAKGFSYSLLNYNFVHLNPQLGINFYRLNIVSKDLSSELSQIRLIDFENLENKSYQTAIYPNPSIGYINIKSTSLLSNFTLLTPDGKIIEEYFLPEGTQYFLMDVNQIDNGIYILKTNDLFHNEKINKIIIKNQ